MSKKNYFVFLFGIFLLLNISFISARHLVDQFIISGHETSTLNRDLGNGAKDFQAFSVIQNGTFFQYENNEGCRIDFGSCNNRTWEGEGLVVETREYSASYPNLGNTYSNSTSTTTLICNSSGCFRNYHYRSYSSSSIYGGYVNEDETSSDYYHSSPRNLAMWARPYNSWCSRCGDETDVDFSNTTSNCFLLFDKEPTTHYDRVQKYSCYSTPNAICSYDSFYSVKGGFCEKFPTEASATDDFTCDFNESKYNNFFEEDDFYVRVLRSGDGKRNMDTTGDGLKDACCGEVGSENTQIITKYTFKDLIGDGLEYSCVLDNGPYGPKQICVECTHSSHCDSGESCCNGECYNSETQICCGDNCNGPVVGDIVYGRATCCNLDGDITTPNAVCTGNTPYCQPLTYLKTDLSISNMGPKVCDYQQGPHTNKSVCSECTDDSHCGNGMKCCQRDGAANVCYDPKETSCCSANATDGQFCSILEGSACFESGGTCYFPGKNTECITRGERDAYNSQVVERLRYSNLNCSGGGEANDKCLVGTIRKDINKQIDLLCGGNDYCTISSSLNTKFNDDLRSFSGDPQANIGKGDMRVWFIAGADSYLFIGGDYGLTRQRADKQIHTDYKSVEVNEGVTGGGRGSGSGRGEVDRPGGGNRPGLIPTYEGVSVRNVKVSPYASVGYSDLLYDDVRYQVTVRSDLQDLFEYRAGLLLNTGSGTVGLEYDQPVGNLKGVYWIKYSINF